MERGYQLNYSDLHYETMHNMGEREKKAKTIIAVLNDFFKIPLNQFSLLDIGSSTGIIDNYLADHFKNVFGIDVDKKAVEFAIKSFNKENLDFSVGDSLNLEFDDNSFDVIICTHIYEHVLDANQMLSEIYRVLRPGGGCYFTAGNRITFMEAHYKLPFLSLIPRSIGHLYLRFNGKGSYYYEKHLTYWGLKKMVSDFKIIDYTKRIIKNPRKFHATYMIKPNSIKHRLALVVVSLFYWISPTYVWILRKL